MSGAANSETATPLHGRLPNRLKIQAVLDGPEIWEAGEAIPTPPRENGGRRRLYPGWMMILFDAMIHIFGTAREVEVEFTDPQVWRMLQAARRRHYPSDPSNSLPERPMRLH